MDPVGKQLLDIAKKELGYTEHGNGYTKFGEWYRKNVDGDHDAYFSTAPWCDMFLAWAADKADVTDQAGQFASTVEHAKWFKKHDAWGHDPEPGAIVFYDWNGSGDMDQIDHVGIVEKVDGHTLHTIEGNAEGYKLMRKTRDTGTVVGYGYPSKVKVEAKYTPKHAAPAPTVDQVGAPVTSTNTHEAEHNGAAEQLPPRTSSSAASSPSSSAAPSPSPPTAPPPPRPHVAAHPRPQARQAPPPVHPVALPAGVTPPTSTRPTPAPPSCPPSPSPPPTKPRTASSGAASPTSKRTRNSTLWNTLHADLTEDTPALYASTPGFR